jgi:hypothetical protein
MKRIYVPGCRVPEQEIFFYIFYTCIEKIYSSIVRTCAQY